jgi:tetratricopeptide (TPR) repeat protein
VNRIFILCSVLTFACSSQKNTGNGTNGGGAGISSDSQIEKTAELAAINDSYLLDIAMNSAGLQALAQKSGWGQFFQGDMIGAIEAFRVRLEAHPDARLGAGRAALRMAEGYERLESLRMALTPDLLEAQSSRPGASVLPGWHTFLRLRLQKKMGKPVDTKDLAKLSAAGLSGLAGVFNGKPDALAHLFDGSGDYEGFAQLPSMTDLYVSRLKFRAALKSKPVAGLGKRWARLKFDKPDLNLSKEGSTFELWDPVSADISRRYYARLALVFLGNGAGCPSFYRARARILLGDFIEAEKELKGLLSASPKTVSLSCAVLTEVLNAAALTRVSTESLARVMFLQGRADEATQLLDTLPTKTIAERVGVAYVRSLMGYKPASNLLDRRDVLAKIILNRVTNLEPKGKGTNDVMELALIDRYVDTIQRKWADTLSRSDKLAQAARTRVASEDKVKAYELSGRNGFDSLAASAVDHYRIRQPRVALKYLLRLARKLPTASALAEQLRDVLSYRAMLSKGGGGVTVGQ